MAGATSNPFEEEALSSIYEYSGGLPRLINTLCDNCLYEASVAGMSKVTCSLVCRVAEDLGLELNGKKETARENSRNGLADDIDNLLDNIEKKESV